MTSATYVTPGSVAPTSTVTFQYDSTGQRTLMDDGPGQVTYQYDGLSRLTSETRTFDAIAGKSFTLSYDYNLGRQLKSLTYSATNAPSDTINYARDKAGQITAITGTPYAGVTSYASGIQYRAWGAPKAVSYGSGFTASAKFNVRMQVSEFDIPGVIGGTYTYNDDRQLSTFVASTPQYQQYDTRMNRTFGYDEYGRLNSSIAGGSGFYATFNPQQDAFGNVTNSSYHYWQNNSTATTFTATYQNNRVASVSDNGLAQTWNYDAMGNRTGIIKTSDGTTLESINIDAVGRGVAAGATLDGEGQAAIFQGNYYIRSTMFGGEIITTVDSSGTKTSGRVLDGGSLLAEQIKFSNGTTTVRWHHRDPLNLVARDTEPGQVKRRVHAVTPNGAQIETSEGVNLTQYYACLLGGNNNPTCTGYNPQAAAAYGYLANQANGLLAGGIKVDGALTSRSLSDIARQIQRTGIGSILFSTALFGTPMGASIGVTAGSWQKREVWHEKYSWGKDGFSTTTMAVSETTFEWVPGSGSSLPSSKIPQIDNLGGLTEADQLRVYSFIHKFVNDQDCVKAIKGGTGTDIVHMLSSPGNFIRVGGNGVLKGDILKVDTFMQNKMGLNIDGVNYVRKHLGQAVFTANAWMIGRQEHLATNSRPSIILFAPALDSGNLHLAKTLVHELIHAAGWKSNGKNNPGILGTKFGKGDDLDHVPDYESILNTCTKGVK